MTGDRQLITKEGGGMEHDNTSTLGEKRRTCRHHIYIHTRHDTLRSVSSWLVIFPLVFRSILNLTTFIVNDQARKKKPTSLLELILRYIKFKFKVCFSLLLFVKLRRKGGNCRTKALVFYMLMTQACACMCVLLVSTHVTMEQQLTACCCIVLHFGSSLLCIRRTVLYCTYMYT